MMWRLKSIFFINRQICNIIWARVSQHLGHLEMRGRKYYALMLEASMEIPHFCIIQILYFLEEWDYMSRKGPKVGQGMLDFLEDLRYDVVSH